MNWDAISAVGEILGALAVLITLIYLARQIRLNTEEVRATRVEGTLRRHSDYNRMLAEDKDLTRIYWAAVEDVHALSEEEKRRWLHLCSVMLRDSEVAYYHYCHGHLPEAIHLSRERWIKRYLGTSGFRWWWGQYSDILDPAFVSYIERIVPAPDDSRPCTDS